MSSDEEIEKGITRRDFIKEAAVAGAAATVLADSAQAGGSQGGEQEATSPATFNTYGADLERLMFLRTYPIAIKMLKSESEIPKGAVRPKRTGASIMPCARHLPLRAARE